VQWQLVVPAGAGADAGACTANFTLENISFY
jgi:hypothetical protein